MNTNTTPVAVAVAVNPLETAAKYLARLAEINGGKVSLSANSVYRQVMVQEFPGLVLDGPDGVVVFGASRKLFVAPDTNRILTHTAALAIKSKGKASAELKKAANLALRGAVARASVASMMPPK